ncbi:MAG: 4Fe-4S binding protein [Chloroflexi bacterium]|nr:4Fe-4S binding protein [Chloroflexota bacterium]
MIKRNILELPFIKTGLTSRWPQLIGRGMALAVFILVIISGLFGTPVGNRNLSIVLIWIAWWAALILILVPLLGRSWCSICPLPLPGEWIQQGSVLGPLPGKKGIGKNWKWPKKMRNIWLQNGSFAMMALFSAVILTKPAVTAWLLLGMIAVAIVMSVLFERRAFCRYLCPVGGFIGLYSLISPVELRIIEQDVCRDHQIKTCYIGNENGYGCPWNVYPGALRLNTNCGACFECLRTCPHDNIAINIRDWGSDLGKAGAIKLDESYKTILMLGSATVYSAVMLGPWGNLKSAAFSIGTGPWWIFAGLFLVINFLILPSLFFLAVKITQARSSSGRSLKYAFKAFSAALIPLGLGAWAAFSLSFVFTNGSYLWGVMSDPMGVGWNLLGTAGANWTPYLSSVTPILVIAALVLGLIGAGQTAKKISSKDQKLGKPWPILLFSFVITVGLLWLLVG